MKLKRDEELDAIGAADRSFSAHTGSLRTLFSSFVVIDRGELWVQDGCREMAEWVAGRYGISLWQARRWVVTAHALEGLPALGDAFARGELGVEKVVELARYATPETETSLIKWAKKVRPATIRAEADVATKAETEQPPKVDKTRFLDWSWDVDGTSLDLWGRLPALEGAQVIDAIDSLARDLPASPDPEDDLERGDLTQDELDDICLQISPHDYVPGASPPLPARELSMEHRRADALVLLVSGQASASGPDATVVVHAELSALQGETRGAVIEGGPALHPDTARRLACDCRLEVVAYDGARTIGIKRSHRNPPRWLRRQALRRDRATCLFPGCGRTAHLQLHHIVSWEHGGATNLDNLATLCHFHHKLVHEYGWSLCLGTMPGTSQWFRPDGSPYEPQPVLRAPPLFELPVAV